MLDGEFAGSTDAAPTRPRDVFLFFDNSDKLHAPDDAATLMRMLELNWSPDTDRPAAQASFE